MKVYNNPNLNKAHYNGVIAIGNFDGLHLGHQKVIKEAKQKAKKKRIPFGIMTFEPLPVMFFNKKIKNHRINSLEQKKTQLKKLKLDFLIIIKFNKNFSTQSAEKFIKEIIFKKTKCKYLYVSKNFKFGFRRQGNIKGKRRGRKIGFPTCNLKLSDYVVPKLGVYAVKVKSKNFYKNGIANIGYRPTFNGQNLLLETNIFGINKNLYNKVISVNFKKFIRSEKKFRNLKHLKKQIKLDIKKAKKNV